MSRVLIKRVQDNRDEVRREAAEIREQAKTIQDRAGGAALGAQDTRAMSRLTKRAEEIAEELRLFDERIDELLDQTLREDVAAESRRLTGNANTGPFAAGGVAYANGRSATYHEGKDSPSFFADLADARRGDADAADRLRRNNAEVGETRALGNTGAVGGSGGDFAPPAWLIDKYVRLARPGRVFADSVHKEDLPLGVSSVNIPKILTGTTTAVQTTQNTAVSQTDPTTASVSSGITSIAGKLVFSRQLVDQSGIAFDQVVMQDLMADYARQLDVQTLVGTGTGTQLRGYLTAAASSPNAQVWTQATPTASGFYSQLAKLQGAINATRYLPPDTVVMAPRRWAWFASFTDSTGRPLVVPTSDAAQNSLAHPSDPAAQGMVGSVLGMRVLTDPNLPLTLGAGSNQDPVLMYRSDDLWLWESDLRAEIFEATYADTGSLLARVLGYSAFIPDRYSASLGTLLGTGLIPPTFAG